MNSFPAKSVLAYAINLLDKNNLPLSKIVIHKFLYFCSFNNIPVCHKFEPYTYGPFSFDLANNIAEMDFWGEIEESKNNISIINIDQYSIPRSLQHAIEEALDIFVKIAKNDYSFDNMELIGTIFFCVDALRVSNKAINIDMIISSYKEWKGEKHSIDKVRRYIDHINSVTPILH